MPVYFDKGEVRHGDWLKNLKTHLDRGFLIAVYKNKGYGRAHSTLTGITQR